MEARGDQSRWPQADRLQPSPLVSMETSWYQALKLFLVSMLGLSPGSYAPRHRGAGREGVNVVLLQA